MTTAPKKTPPQAVFKTPTKAEKLAAKPQKQKPPVRAETPKQPVPAAKTKPVERPVEAVDDTQPDLNAMLEGLLKSTPRLSEPGTQAEGQRCGLVAIVGKPNVGKSMLLNAILGKERVIVSDVPGTTRDAIDTQLDFMGKHVLLIDTAGIKKRGQIETGIEQYSVIRSMRAIDRCDVALLVLDATEMFSAQDTHIAGYIQQAVKGIVIIVNKWDLVSGENQAIWAENTRKQFKFMAYAPVMFLSAKFGKGVGEVMPQAYQVYQERIKQIPAAELRGVIRDAIASHNLPRKGKMMLSVKGVTQTDINPPTFTFQVNSTKLVHFSYKRFLENKLRESFGFNGTPLRLEFKAGGD